MVRQPLPAHGAEVAQEAPGIAAPDTILNEEANDKECKGNKQSNGAKHG